MGENIKATEVFDALKKATRDVLNCESELLERNCSERAIVHWLAIYFLNRIREEKGFQSLRKFFSMERKENGRLCKTDGYTVDVEYNRIGSEEESKHLYNMSERCAGCASSSDCLKKPKGKTNDSIMLDMIFHRRSKNKKGEKNPLCDNILCVEVKMKNATEQQIKCDEERVQLLVDSKEKEKDMGLKEPKYLLGATIHFVSDLEAQITLYDSNGKNKIVSVKK